jgi:hypothetical protein
LYAEKKILTYLSDQEKPKRVQIYKQKIRRCQKILPLKTIGEHFLTKAYLHFKNN